MARMRLAGLNRLAGRRTKGALLLGLFLSVFAMASIGTFHEAFHPNANAPDHHCVVTLLASGQVDAAATVPTVVVVPAEPVGVCQCEVSRPSSVSFNLPLSRGPPALLS
jgi:hypothetical protein